MLQNDASETIMVHIAFTDCLSKCRVYVTRFITNIIKWVFSGPPLYFVCSTYASQLSSAAMTLW